MTAPRIFVDTSALLALLDEDDRFHRDAADTLQAIGPTAELLTHNYVHAEALAIARRRLGSAAVARLVSELLPRLATIWVDEALHAAALAALGAGTGSASLVDRVSFEVMRREGIDQAFAFDADFEAQGFRRPAIDAKFRQGRLSEAATPYGTDVTEEAELVSVSEIASRARRPISTVQSWRRRHPDFPEPVASLAAGPVWTWPVVERWIAGRSERSTRRRPTTRGLVLEDAVDEGDELPVPPAIRATRVGTKLVIEEADLQATVEDAEMLPLPAAWSRTITGEPMPNAVALVRRSKTRH